MTSKTVADVMTTGVVSIDADAKIAEAVRLLDEHRVAGLPVVDGSGHLVGVLSRTDVVRARVTEHLWQSWPGLAVRHLMTAPALTTSPGASLESVAAVMERDHVHRLVVVREDGRTPVGIISMTDLVHAIAEGVG